MKSPINAFLAVALVGLLTLWAGCATTEAYVGPDFTSPIVRTEQYTHWNMLDLRNPFWETHKIFRFENPLYHPVAFDVECDLNFMHVDVAARSVERLLLDRADGDCKVIRVR